VSGPPCLKVGVSCPGVAADATRAGEVVRRLCDLSQRGGMYGLVKIASVKLSAAEVVVEVALANNTDSPIWRRHVADAVAEEVRAAGAAVRGIVVPGMGKWAFGGDVEKLTPEQRKKVRAEILAVAAEQSNDFAKKVLEDAAERVGSGK
jgi:hypothetical protein